MKLKILFVLLVVILSFGCSSIFSTLSSSEIKLNITKISGDEIEILTDKTDEQNTRIIVESKNLSHVGYIKILDEIKNTTDNSWTLDTKKLDGDKNYVRLNLEVKIDNSYLESDGSEFDQVLIWIGNNSVSLYDGIENNNQNIKQNKFEDFSIFNFDFKLNKNTKKYDFSVQSLNLINKK